MARNMLLTKAIKEKLLANSKATEKALMEGTEQPEHKPVVKFFMPDGGATWLISEMDETGYMFGLCDLGMGFPELGYVDLNELKQIRGGLGLPVEREIHRTKFDKTLIEYARIAWEEGKIVL